MTALADIKVLDLSRVLAGPWCTETKAAPTPRISCGGVALVQLGKADSTFGGGGGVPGGRLVGA